MNWLQRLINQTHTQLYNKLFGWVKKRSDDNKFSVRTTVARIEVGNFLASLSTTGLMALGVIPMSLITLGILASVFIMLGVFGRYVDSVEDDVERLLKYEQLTRESSNRCDTVPPSSDSLQ